jgi:hypothetical protein
MSVTPTRLACTIARRDEDRLRKGADWSAVQSEASARGEAHVELSGHALGFRIALDAH